MPGITGIGTTFNLPNYHGQLFSLTPADTPLLSAIGGLTGGGQTDSTTFEWQTYDLRDPDQRTRTEGATAPTAEQRTRQNVTNVLQIHQERVNVSYTKQAAIGNFNGANINGTNPVQDEMSWQVEQSIKQIARDANWSFINGRFQSPTDNTTPRRTRGVLQAITTNLVHKGTNVATGASSATGVITPVSAHTLTVGTRVVFSSIGTMTNVVAGRVYFVTGVNTTVSFVISATAGGAPITVGTSTANIDYHSLSATALDVPTVNALAQQVFDNGGLTDGLGTFLVNSSQKVALTRAYASAYGQVNPFITGERIGGVAVEQVVTDFGTLNIVVDRAVPQDAIILASLSQLRPVFMNIPGKGVFFEEPLAKTGASEDVQIYGEIGLEYGAQSTHGVLRGLPVS
jgi:hypothetical protein